jgi:RNA polymerase sigma-70 factor (ECF subfamily)
MDVEPPRQLDKARRDRFDQATAKHREVLHRVAMRCCVHNRAVADDLVQDTYERAWKRFDSLQDLGRALPWLIRILHNCWIDVCRKSARNTVLSVAEVPEHPHTVDEPSPWQTVTIDDFHRALEQLREPYRSVAILHDVDHLSNADIAQRLAIPYATVASRLHRAHRRLQELLRIIVDEARED